MAQVSNPSLVSLPPTLLPTEWTLADLQRHLGGVPLERIRLYPPPGMATEQDLLRVADREDLLCELVDGILVEKVMACYESLLAGLLIHLIHDFLEEHPLGIVLAPNGALRIAPGRIRVPDVSFIGWHRFPGRKLPRARLFDTAPDLAVEILSESNTEQEMEQKVREYFEAGTELVWLIDPRRRTARVYTSAERCIPVGPDGVLDGGNVLPGFSVRLRDLFGRAARQSE